MSLSDVRAVCFDVGGTLVRIDDGPATARLAGLLEVEFAAMRGFLQERAKRCRTSRGQLAAQLTDAFGRTDALEEVDALLQRLREEARAPVLYPDVAAALGELRRRGYAIFLLTNVVGAIAPTDEPDLYGLADRVFSSCDIGFVKPQREAFRAVERATGLSGAEILHVGDSAGADVEGARGAGWRALRLDRDACAPGPGTIGGLHDLLELLDQPLPSLPATGEDWLHVTGEATEIGLRTLLLLPVAAPVARSRGRRYRVAIEGERPRPRIVLSVGGRAALVPPVGLDRPGARADVRIRALSPRTDRTVPPDLAHRLAREGLDLAVLAPHELRQVLLMLAEAASAGVRQARLSAAVEAIRARNRRTTA